MRSTTPTPSKGQGGPHRVATMTGRPPDGSERAKRAYILVLLVEDQKNITRAQVKELMGWDDETLEAAIQDVATLSRPAAAV